MNANSSAGCVKNTCRIEVGLMRIFLLNSHAVSKCFSSELQFSFLGPDNNTVFDSNIELNGHHYRWGQLIKPNSCWCFDFLSLRVVFVIKKVPSFPVYTQLNTNIFLCLGQRASDWSAWGRPKRVHRQCHLNLFCKPQSQHQHRCLTNALVEEWEQISAARFLNLYEQRLNGYSLFVIYCESQKRIASRFKSYSDNWGRLPQRYRWDPCLVM